MSLLALASPFGLALFFYASDTSKSPAQLELCINSNGELYPTGRGARKDRESRL